MELCLGTVQFGLDYGIRGQKKPEKKEAIRILELAYESGIRAFDTATAYGNAEDILGEFLLNHNFDRNDIFVSTKMKPNYLDEFSANDYRRVIKESLLKSLDNLHLDYVDAYMLHSARYAFREDILEALLQVEKEGLARKVGVSVYEPDEAFACFKNCGVNFIQAPYSVFDHRMKDAGVFSKEKKGDCEIHTRSAFVQGLVTMSEDEVPDFLGKARPIIKRINAICKKENISPVELALAYVKREDSISHLVFGVDSQKQLMEDVKLFSKEIPEDLLNSIENEFSGIEAEIVMPSLWKK